MIESISDTVLRSITIAVDAESCAPLTVEIAVDLAASMNTQLKGVFIEDADLLSIAGLPFSCEITLITGESRTLDPRQLQRSYNQISTKFRQLLRQKAEKSSVEYSFSTLRGRKRDLISKHLIDAGYLIVERSARNSAWKTPTKNLTKRILLVESDQQSKFLPVVELIRRKFPQHRIELLTSGESISDPQQSSVKQPGGRALESAGSFQQKPDIQKLETMMTRTDKPLDYVLVNRNIEPESLNKIFNWARCPVVVVG